MDIIKITSTAATVAEKNRNNPPKPGQSAKALLGIGKYRTVFVQGEPHILSATRVGTDVEFERMADAGFVLITSIGSENLYFKFRDDDGEEYDGFCKCL